MSSGSGFFISADGYVVTNNHVVENAEEITVTLKDERELKARVIGRDEGTDLAVLKVEGSGFPYVNFENAAKPRVGDWVITVGNPLAGRQASAGIVRPTPQHRRLALVDYLQIDALDQPRQLGRVPTSRLRPCDRRSTPPSSRPRAARSASASPSPRRGGDHTDAVAGAKSPRYMGATVRTEPEIAEASNPGQEGGAGRRVTRAVSPAAKAGVQPATWCCDNGQNVSNYRSPARGGVEVGDTPSPQRPARRPARTIEIRSACGLGIRADRSANDNEPEEG